MAIPAPGTAISVNTIVGEFGGTAPHSLSEYYRGGGLVPNVPGNANIPTSGAIPMGGFYGSANRTAVALAITSNTYNYDVYTNRSPAYVAGSTDITVTVNPGVTVGSTSTGSYALSVPSSFNPADIITIVNNGVIQGMGGNGATGGYGGNGGTGSGGGNAIYVNRPTIITNNGTIAGGGGGGGGGGAATSPKGGNAASGGGGGGGSGFNGGSGGPAGSPGGGAVGGSGGNGTSPAGGGGGPGATGSQGLTSGAGGSGGGRGAAGSNGGPAPSSNTATYGGSGGAAGRYITGNPLVTWPATGTRQGGVA